jgi:uncharacterized membrane protein
VLSFLVIGLLWIGHNRGFAVIARVDRKLMFLNLLVLMTVAYLPFPTAVLGEHGNTTAAAALYGGSMGLTGLLLALLWSYASHGRRLIRQDVPATAIRHLRLRSYIVPVCYLPSIPVAFVSMLAANILWLMSFVLGFILNRVVQPAD